MEYRRLGSAGVKVSALSFGAWVTFGDQVGDEIATECMKRAYAGGINFFDNAEAYAGGRAEEVMGSIIKKLGWTRDSYLVSSKVFWGGEGPNQQGLSRKHVVEACHAALRRLQVDYLDFYFCHRPDPATPIEETVRAMHDLIVQGHVLYWGTSEWGAQEIVKAWDIAEKYGLHKPQMEQPQYSMLWRDKVEKEYRELYSRLGLGTTIWSPLMSGLLTGKYSKGIPEGTRISLPSLEWLRSRFESKETEAMIGKVRTLEGIAHELDASMAQLALAWCLKNPNVSSVITGASRPDQLTENLKAMDVLGRLDEGVMTRIEAVLANRPA